MGRIRTARKPEIGFEAFSQPEAPAAGGARPNKHDLQKSRTKRLLLQAGREVYASRGFDAPTVADVTRAAGVSRAAFYLHYASREEHMFAIFEREVRWDYRLYRSLTSADLQTEAAVRAWIDRYIARYRLERRYILIVYRTLSIDPSMANHIVAQRKATLSKLARRLDELRLLKTDGSFDDERRAEMHMIMAQLEGVALNAALQVDARDVDLLVANTAHRLWTFVKN